MLRPIDDDRENDEIRLKIATAGDDATIVMVANRAGGPPTAIVPMLVADSSGEESCQTLRIAVPEYNTGMDFDYPVYCYEQPCYYPSPTHYAPAATRGHRPMPLRRR